MVSATPVVKKKQQQWKSAHMVWEEAVSPRRYQEEELEEAGPSQEQNGEETELINE